MEGMEITLETAFCTSARNKCLVSVQMETIHRGRQEFSLSRPQGILSVSPRIDLIPSFLSSSFRADFAIRCTIVHFHTPPLSCAVWLSPTAQIAPNPQRETGKAAAQTEPAKAPFFLPTPAAGEHVDTRFGSTENDHHDNYRQTGSFVPVY